MTTPIEVQTDILAELWLNHKDEPEFEDFVTYNDLGLPLAYCINNGIVEANEVANKFIRESFALLVEALGLEDTGFDCLGDLFSDED
jgi:hypothetical protein